MRGAFIDALVEVAEDDDSVALLTGDLGFSVLEPFAERFPSRFFNAGVAERNMVGLATGMASNGMRPYAYSIATFASMCAYEFLRNGAVLHDLPVRLVGIGGGVDYGHNGPTHYAMEDIALMRPQPGLAVVAPADPEQARSATLATAGLPGPAYLRIGKSETPVPGLDGRFELGRASMIGAGRDIAIVTSGSIAIEAVKAAELLADEGVETTVAVTASISPPPLDDLASLLDTVDLTISLESHYRDGGLGSLLCELVAERGIACRVLRLGFDSMPGPPGSAQFLYERHGLNAAGVAQAATAALDLSPG
ncbi:MAG: transketolase family protein [Solirubrobacterales bacterium]